jgi:hypothetical protein
MFNKLNARQVGSKGGSAKTKRKSQASRANGKLGGRPPSKTLAERLLRRSIHPEQQKYIRLALSDMLANERHQLEEYFHLKGGLIEEYYAHDEEMFRTLDSTVWRTKSRRVPKEIQYLIKKFRLAANYYLRDVPTPKPYTVEYQQPSLGQQRLWDIHHLDSRIPCPPRKGRVDVRYLHGFDLFESKHKRGTTWTVKSMMEAGGGIWSKKRAEVAINWLNYEYPQSSSKESSSEARSDWEEDILAKIPF